MLLKIQRILITGLCLLIMGVNAALTIFLVNDPGKRGRGAWREWLSMALLALFFVKGGHSFFYSLGTREYHYPSPHSNEMVILADPPWLAKDRVFIYKRVGRYILVSLLTANLYL